MVLLSAPWGPPARLRIGTRKQHVRVNDPSGPEFDVGGRVGAVRTLHAGVVISGKQ